MKMKLKRENQNYAMEMLVAFFMIVVFVGGLVIPLILLLTRVINPLTGIIFISVSGIILWLILERFNR